MHERCREPDLIGNSGEPTINPSPAPIADLGPAIVAGVGGTDPTWGRFVNEDPIGFRGSGANSYVYVGDSPTMFTDPTGLEAEQNVADCAKGGALGGFGLFIKFTLVTFLISAAVGCIGSVFIPPPSDVLVNSGQAFAPIFPGSWPH